MSRCIKHTIRIKMESFVFKKENPQFWCKIHISWPMSSSSEHELIMNELMETMDSPNGANLRWEHSQDGGPCCTLEACGWEAREEAVCRFVRKTWSSSCDCRTSFMLYFACFSELLGSAKKVNVNFQDTDGWVGLHHSITAPASSHNAHL